MPLLTPFDAAATLQCVRFLLEHWSRANDRAAR
jgi:hypothetical protein